MGWIGLAGFWLVQSALTVGLLGTAAARTLTPPGGGTLLHFSLHVETRVTSRIQAILSAVGRAANPIVAERLANRKLRWAVGEIRRQSGTRIPFHTSALASRPLTWVHGRTTSWQATDDLTLESGNGRRIGGLLALLEKQLEVVSIRYRPVGSSRTRHALMLKGLHELAGLAHEACAALGRTETHLLGIRITAIGHPFRPTPLLTFAAAQAPARRVPGLHHTRRVKVELAARVRCAGSRSRPGGK
jgi:hypothetical protein